MLHCMHCDGTRPVLKERRGGGGGGHGAEVQKRAQGEIKCCPHTPTCAHRAVHRTQRACVCLKQQAIGLCVLLFALALFQVGLNQGRGRCAKCEVMGFYLKLATSKKGGGVTPFARN